MKNILIIIIVLDTEVFIGVTQIKDGLRAFNTTKTCGGRNHLKTRMKRFVL